MKDSKRLFYLAHKFGITPHRHYKALCGLAATGQLGGPQMYELNEHIRICCDCREFLESVAQVSTQIIPPLSELQVSATEDSLPVGMRERFISRLACEDSEPQPRFRNAREHRLLAPHGHSLNCPDEKGESKKKAGWSGLRWPAAALAASTICAIGGLYVSQRTAVRLPAQGWPNTVTAVHEAVSPPGTPPRGSGIDQLEHDKIALESQLAALRMTLSDSQMEQHRLVEKLAATNARLTLAEQSNSGMRSFFQTTQQSGEEVTRLQKEGETLRERLAETQAILVEQENATHDANAKLDAALDELDRQRDVESAKSQLGDLAGARNLHIVDVYDADARGKRQPAFGRVFYVEGKSLVFCAYDLDRSRRLNANVVFHVWGGMAGRKESIHNLGILHNDGTVQDRWVMTFDDQAVLAQINSVFVTVESANKAFDSPRGKKVLYAYLGSSPNHP